MDASYTGHHLIYTNRGNLVYDGDVCISYVGRTDGNGTDGSGKGQIINLFGDCLSIGKILHETLHGLGLKLYFLISCYGALGATHEHMRWDRDGFVRILDQNMLQGAKKKNFETTSTDAYSTFGTPFDYQSVMHHVVLKMA